MNLPHSEKNGLLRDWQRRVANRINTLYDGTNLYLDGATGQARGLWLRDLTGTVMAAFRLGASDDVLVDAVVPSKPVILRGRDAGGGNVNLFTANPTGAATGRFFDKSNFTPTFTNGGTFTTAGARWCKSGNLVRSAVRILWTGTGAAGDLLLNLPLAPVGFDWEILGHGYYYQGSNHIHVAVQRFSSSNAVRFMPHSATAALQGSALMNGWSLEVAFTYEWV